MLYTTITGLNLALVKECYHQSSSQVLNPLHYTPLCSHNPLQITLKHNTTLQNTFRIVAHTEIPIIIQHFATSSRCQSKLIHTQTLYCQILILPVQRTFNLAITVTVNCSFCYTPGCERTSTKNINPRV